MENLDKFNEVDCETRAKIHKLCGEYLGIEWKNADVNQLNVTKIRQGMINSLYLCELTSSFHQDKVSFSSISHVVIKFFDEIVTARNSTHVITSYLIAGEKDLGPRILGVFPGGIISEYFGTRNYGKQDDLNDSTVKLLATKLAKLHALELPIIKDKTEEWHEYTFDDYINDLINVKLKQAIEEAKLENFAKVDICKELKEMEKTIKNVKSPLVMAHLDFNRGNILVDETLTNEYAHDIESIDPSIDIKFVDLDYSGYMYRGVDFGKYFSEWRIDVEPLIVVVDQFPSDKEMDIFLSAYRMECGKQFGDEWLENEVNSIERLRQESRVFALNAHLQDISIFLSIAYKEENLEKKKEILKMGDTCLSGFLKMKNKFILDGSIQL